MGHKSHNRHTQAQRMLDHLAADKKKTAFAVALATVMAFLWFRVFTGRGPDPATADSSVRQEQPGPQLPPRNISYLTLPNIPGRNDYMNRDFFAARDWECFRPSSAAQRDPATQAQTVPSNRAPDIAARMAHKLKLEAVLKNGTVRAFINDRLLGLGDRITVREGPDTCEFEVVRIYEDSVLVGCNGTQVTLKLTQHLDVAK